MRRNIPTFLAILLLGTLILCSACTSPDRENTVQQNSAGLVQAVSTPSHRISYDSALQNLRMSLPATQTGSDGRIYYLLAKDLDDQGNAASWFFGVNDGSGMKLMIFDRTGRTELPLSEASVPSEEIHLETIVPPARVITDNRDRIFSNPVSAAGQNELELREGIFTLTIPATTGNRVLKFNATTGGLIR